MSELNTLQSFADEMVGEALRAKSIYKRDFASHHEAYAVIKEEIDELWDEIKKKEKDYDRAAMRKEAIQVGAMCLRFINELT
jgi:glutamyl-tRNA reductase